MNWSTAQANAALKRAGVKDHLQQACGAPKPAKYRNVKCWVDGHRFDSKAEARAYVTLRTLAGTGEIWNLELQPSYVLQEAFTDSAGKRHREIVYRADFTFLRRGNKQIAVDVKGIETPAFKIKRKMFALKYPQIGLELWR